MTCGLYLWPLFLWWFCVHTCVCPNAFRSPPFSSLEIFWMLKDDPQVAWLSLWEEVNGIGNNPMDKYSGYIPVMGTVPKWSQTGVCKTATAMPGCVLRGAAVVTFLFVCFCFVSFCDFPEASARKTWMPRTNWNSWELQFFKTATELVCWLKRFTQVHATWLGLLLNMVSGRETSYMQTRGF